MTRINAAIPVEQLCDQHLLAEHREIKRIPNLIKKKVEEGKSIYLGYVSNRFKLGKGHVTFFYDKLKYLAIRYKKIHKECIRRGFNVTDYSECFDDLPTHLYNDWDDSDPKIYEEVAERITERLSKMNNIKYYRFPLAFAGAWSLLEN